MAESERKECLSPVRSSPFLTQMVSPTHFLLWMDIDPEVTRRSQTYRMNCRVLLCPCALSSPGRVREGFYCVNIPAGVSFSPLLFSANTGNSWPSGPRRGSAVARQAPGIPNNNNTASWRGWSHTIALSSQLAPGLRSRWILVL